MSAGVASAAWFEFACYQARDVSIKMSDWAHGLSQLIYNKSNKLKFGLFMERNTHGGSFAAPPSPTPPTSSLFLNVTT